MQDGKPEVATHTTDKGAGGEKGLDRRRFLGGVAGVTAAVAGGLGGLTELGGVVPREAEAKEISPDGRLARAFESFEIRVEAAKDELQRGVIFHQTNGDEERYPDFIGNFSKTLPHNSLGEVDPAAYRALLDALETGDFDELEQVPQGGVLSYLNPLGGLTFTLDGADSPAVRVPAPPPALASAELGAQAAEVYWQALLRDVPFADYEANYAANGLVRQAADDLGGMSGYTGPSENGTVTPQTLFRLDYPGALEGPMVSQFLLTPFRFDGVPIDPKISTAAPGIDFLTFYDEWLAAQRGFPGGAPTDPDPRDPVLRYPRNVRDLARTAGQDAIYSQYFKAALIILFTFGNAALDDANPYKTSSRQGGFSSLGFAHILNLVGQVHKSERHTWYQKWFVHRFLRPEAFGGRVHNRVIGAADYPISQELLDSPVLPLIHDYNRDQNLARLGIDEGSFLLPLIFRRGGPTHPSFPAGHAVSAGACVTALKAWFDEDFEWPDPVVPSADGLSLEPYVGPPLTLGGELNKLVHNLSIGRDMSGVHWRADDTSGNTQGEEVAIRIMREERATYPEPFSGFTLTKFDGTTITV